MNTVDSATRQYLALYLPWLPAERAIRANAAPPDTAFALTHNVAGGVRIAAVSRLAAPLRLVGLTLADCRARSPSLAVVAHDPGADAILLEWLADACESYSPSIATDGAQTILIDITGCATGRSDDTMLVDDVRTRFARYGIILRSAIASTPDAASALAEHDVGEVSALPIRALRVDPRVHHALRRAGLTTIGALADLPSAPLAARFGEAVPKLLARLIGDIDDRLVPRRRPPEIFAEHRATEPVLTTAGATIVVERLLDTVAGALQRRGNGGRRFELSLFRSDGHVARLAVETSQTTRDTAAIRRLIAERIDTLNDPMDPGFGFDLIRLAVPVVELLPESQIEFESQLPGGREVDALLDRLKTRLGPSRVRRLTARNSHVPEQACFDLPATPQSPQAWEALVGDDPPLRPLHLFTPPQKIAVMAEVPDGPPRWFRWKRAKHEVCRAEGPQRVAAEWWHRRDGQGLTRDYYRVENTAGGRFWVFRHGLYGIESAQPDWYIHGLFA